MNKKTLFNILILVSIGNYIFSQNKQSGLIMNIPKPEEISKPKPNDDDIQLLDGLENPVIRATKNGKYGLLDNTKKVILPFEYDYIIRGNGNGNANDLVIIQKAGKVGYANSKGIIIEPKYDCVGTTTAWNNELKDYSSEYLNVSKGSDWKLYLYKPLTKTVTETKYSNQSMSGNNIDTLFSVNCILKKKYGAVNQFGKIKIPLIYNEPIIFEKGFAIVKAGIDSQGFPLKGVLNQNNVFVIPPIYSYLEKDSYFESDNKTISFRFRCGSNEKSNELKYSILDVTGKIIIPPLYSAIQIQNIDAGGCYWYVQKDGKNGLIDNEGNILVPSEFDQVDRVFNNKVRVVKRGQEQIIDISKK